MEPPPFLCMQKPFQSTMPSVMSMGCSRPSGAVHTPTSGNVTEDDMERG